MPGDGQDAPAFGADDAELAGINSLCGDFYCASDDVTRGVALGGLAATARTGSEAGPVEWDGDFYGKFEYQEPDELLHGMPAGLGESGGGNIFEPGALAGKLPLQDGFSAPFGKGQAGLAASGEALAQGELRFTENLAPPMVPSDPFFALESSTIYLALNQKLDPSQLGNTLLDFFEHEVVSSVMKIRTLKFWIKASVFVDGRQCLLKVRLYHRGADQFAVEFQRRSGDAVAFQYVFQKAKGFYLDRFSGRKDEQAHTALGTQPRPYVENTADSEVKPFLDPFLDLADLEELPSLQAEAAGALAEAALHSVVAAAALCHEQAFDKILKLLQSSEEDVAYPTAQLLAHLTTCHQAEYVLASEGLLLQLLTKVGSKRTSSLVQGELAKVVPIAAQRCAGKLTVQGRDEIANALNDVRVNVGHGSGNASVCEYLEGARCVLGL